MQFYIRVFCTITFFAAVTGAEARNADYYFDLALKNNARLAADRNLAAAAQGDYRKESVFNENPELMLGLMNVPVNTFPALNKEQMSSFSVGISQRIALPWESNYRKTAAEFRAATTGFAFEQQKATVRYETAERLSALIYVSERKKILIDAKKLLTATLRILANPRKDQRNTAGQILEARAALATIDNDILANDFELEKLWVELESLCGEKLERETSFEGMESWKAAAFPAIDFNAETLQASIIYRKAESEVRSQQAMLSLSRAALFPEVKLQMNYMFRQQVPGSSMGDNMVTVAASTPMPLFYPLKNRHEIDAQSERLKATESLLIETGRQLTAQVKTERARLTALLASIENYSRAILPSHISAHRSHLATVNVMGGSAAEALLSYRMYLTASEERLKQIREAHSAVNRLQYLLAKGDK